MHFREFGRPAKARNSFGAFQQGGPCSDGQDVSIDCSSVSFDPFHLKCIPIEPKLKTASDKMHFREFGRPAKARNCAGDSNRGDPVLTDKMFQSIVVQSVLIRFTWNAFQSNRNWKLHLIRCISESLDDQQKLEICAGDLTGGTLFWRTRCFNRL